MVRHQAALAAGQLTRGTSGVNRPPLEVMMSRPLHLWEKSVMNFTYDVFMTDIEQVLHEKKPFILH
jgi:hypothetical protein